MNTFGSHRGIMGIQVGLIISLGILLVFVAAFTFRHYDSLWMRTALEKSMEKTQLIQTMRSDLLASAEAEKSSVMADTDEASSVFADQSREASKTVEKARQQFEGLVDRKNQEGVVFDSFSSCWAKLREVDREVLSLAVQNTNLKALRLSFGPAAATVKRIETSMNQVMDSAAASPNGSGMIRFATKALTNIFNIYMLEAPHIAETTDARMDLIEEQMKQLNKEILEDFNGLEALAGDQTKSYLDEAHKSYDEFRNINAEIISLSRQNSNIRSFAVSLDQKRHLMAQCLDLLTSLQESVRQGSDFKATR